MYGEVACQVAQARQIRLISSLNSHVYLDSLCFGLNKKTSSVLTRVLMIIGLGGVNINRYGGKDGQSFSNKFDIAFFTPEPDALLGFRAIDA